MKSKWVSENFKYDGSQLRCQFAYLKHELLGDSILAWRGPCDVTLEHMADGEDLLAGAAIRGSDMIHFIVEVFGWNLSGGVALQRLLASLASEVLREQGQLQGFEISRKGDDLYWQGGKLSISVAAQSPLSVVIHFAVNVSNEGTPVKTSSLEDLRTKPETFARAVLEKFVAEYSSLQEATVKVRPIN